MKLCIGTAYAAHFAFDNLSMQCHFCYQVIMTKKFNSTKVTRHNKIL